MTHAQTPLDAATFIVKLLREQGHVAYFAGGCVRDALLGLTPKDYDVATDAPPDRVASIFRNTHFVGEAFGVTLVKLKGQSVEVATFRREWGYTDGRHPTHVEFCSAEHDAQRRDFTINGLFENPLATREQGRIIDYVGGVSDLQQGILRAIGSAEDRFAEDYLRMLRAVRFASRFGFVIEEQTACAIRQHAHQLGQISRERIGQEVQSMLSQPRRVGLPQSQEPDVASRKALAAVRAMSSLQLDAPVLDEPHRPAQGLILKALDQLDSTDVDYPAMLLGWMLDRHLPLLPADPSADSAGEQLTQFVHHQSAALIDHWRRSLVLSNAITTAMSQTLACMVQAMDWPDKSVALRKRLLASPGWSRAILMLKAGSHLPFFAGLVLRIEADTPALVQSSIAPAPLVSGEDLIKMGQKPGPSFRRLLDQAYDEQLEGRLSSKADALHWLEHLIKKQ